MNIGFFAGSFDPFTNGHLHVVEMSVKLFDKVIIGISINRSKNRIYDIDLMKKAIENTLESHNLYNVKVVSYDELSGDVAIKNNATCFIRGIRNNIDYNYEKNLASLNEELFNLDTIYIRAGKFENISSSMVNELIAYKRDISKYVPDEIINAIYKRNIK